MDQTEVLGVKVIIGLAVVAVLAGLATNWVRHRGEDFLHDRLDTALPGKVEAHPWAPLRHGKPHSADRVRFQSGSLTTKRCQATLGTYTVAVSHAFSFTKAVAPVRPGCPGRMLETQLAGATHVSVEKHGSAERLVFTDDDDHTVVTLQGR
jgi:hypothetical protein